MKQIIQVIIFSFLLFPSVVMAQTDDSEARAKEREIKTTGLYLYGEAVANTKDEAIKLAKSILASEINQEILTRKDWQYAREISAKDVEYSVESIDLARGSKMRAITFVRKDGIEAIFDKSKAPTVSLTDKKVEKKPTPTLAQTPTPAPISEVQKQQVQTPPAPTNNPVLDEILPCKTVKEVSAVFEKYKKKGKLVYGRTGTNLSSENSYLMIYNQAGEVTAILDKGQGSSRKNLLTGEQASIYSFNAAAQIWFQIFE